MDFWLSSDSSCNRNKWCFLQFEIGCGSSRSRLQSRLCTNCCSHYTLRLDSANAAHKCNINNETFEASAENIFLRCPMPDARYLLWLWTCSITNLSHWCYLSPLDNLSAVRKILQTVYLGWSIGSIVHAGAQVYGKYILKLWNNTVCVNFGSV